MSSNKGTKSPRALKKEKISIPSQMDINGLALNSPILKGYMYKKSHSFDSFNKRYFALYNGCIVYYRKEDEYEKDVVQQTLKVRASTRCQTKCLYMARLNVCVCFSVASSKRVEWGMDTVLCYTKNVHPRPLKAA